jgi:hypothetical protein
MPSRNTAAPKRASRGRLAARKSVSSKLTPDELVERTTGAEVSTGPYLAYLLEKYGFGVSYDDDGQSSES